jgi:hypothetical protein
MKSELHIANWLLVVPGCDTGGSSTTSRVSDLGWYTQ